MNSSGQENQGSINPLGSLARPGILVVVLFGLMVPGALGEDAPSTQSEIAAAINSTPAVAFDHHEEDGVMHKEEEHREWIFASDGQPLKDLIKRLTISMSARIRPEYVENTRDFNNSTDDNADFASNRFRLGVGADLSDQTHVFIEAQNNSVWGDSASLSDPTGDDDFKLYRGFIQTHNLFGTSLSVKIGRQELVYGTELILGDADFGPGLSHDIIKATYETGNLTIDGWFGKVVENDLFIVDTEDVTEAGIYGTLTNDDESLGLDFYWVNVSDRRASQDKRHTVGTRVFGCVGIFGFNSEFAWQFGESDPNDTTIKAFAWENNLTFGLQDVEYAPEFELGYAIGSGDKRGTDSSAETFNPLFQDNHPRYGLSDLIVTSNVQVITVKASAEICPGARVGIAGYDFNMHRNDSGTRQIGQEVDIYFDLSITEHVSAQLAWAHFMPGSSIKRSFGDDDDADRLYLHLVVGI